MAYNLGVLFVDYKSEQVELSFEVFRGHIQQFHPEVTINCIQSALAQPDEVWESCARQDVELYFKRKNLFKERYLVVVVKKIRAGNFISSAYTKNKMGGRKKLYPEEVL